MEHANTYMQQFTAVIRAAVKVGHDLCRIDFETPWTAAPLSGQFVTVQGGDDTLLKRPFSIAAWADGMASIIVKRVGPGSDYITGLQAGQTLDVIGPLGNGFPRSPGYGRIIYVGGGCGLPPLLMDAAQRGPDVPKTAVLGFRTAADAALIEAFTAQGIRVITATEDGSLGTQGRVTDILKKNLDSEEGNCIIFSSGPMGMLQAVARILQERGLKGYLCIERYMACGIGVCYSCVQAVRDRDGTPRYVRTCREGPVFEADQLIWEQP